MDNTVLIFLIGYFAVVLGIGFWALRSGAGRSLEGFLLGGRRVGPLVTALTLQSSSMSGYMFLGAGALGFQEGYWALWYAVGDVGGGVLSLSVIGRRMRKLSEILGALTSIEYLEKRYPHPATRLIGAVLTVFLLGAYVLAQFIAGGKGLALVTGLDYSIALGLAVTIIVGYTFVGGYLAVAYTDFFQSVVMLIGVIWIGTAAVSALGGFTAANTAVAEVDPTLISVWGRGLAYEGQWGIAIGAVMVFSIGVLGWPHLVTRHMAMARPTTARKAGGFATVFNLLFVPTPYLVGIMAIVLLPQLGDPELAVFSVAEALLPPAVTGLVMAAIMAAIMSTADSLLLQTGSVASRDLFQRFVRPDATEAQMVWVSRGLILLIGTVGFFVALVEPPTVFQIVVFSTSVLGSAFLPAFVCAVWWRKANTPGAIASMLAGAVVAFSWETLGTTSVHPMLAGILSSSMTMVVVSLLTANTAPVSKDILDAIDEASTV